MCKFEKIKKYYLISLLVMLLVRSINAYSLLPSVLDSTLFGILGVFGGLIVIHELSFIIKSKKIISVENLLLLFLFFFGISIIVNRSSFFGSNVKLLVWTSLYLIGIYRFSERNYNEKIFFNVINKLLIVFLFLMSLVSFFMYIFKFGYIYVYGSGARDHIRIGFLESRLFGVFGDPNYGATIALVVLILTFYYLIKEWSKKNIFLRIFYMLNIILQFSIIILTGSRSALLISYVVVVLFAFTYALGFFDRKQLFLKIFLSVLVSVIIFSGYFVLQIGTKHALQALPQHINYQIKINDTSKKNKTEGIKLQSGDKEKISLTRKDVAENEDISNMRFSIWKSAIEIFKTSPLVGTTPRNLINYAHQKMPDTFIAQKSIVVHNAYINVLVSTGVLGFIPFMLFLIVNGISCIVFYFKNREGLPNYYLVYLIILIALVLSGLFNNEIVLVNTVGTFFFWFYLGNLNGYMKGKLVNDKSKDESR